MDYKALYYKKKENNNVQCELCPHNCQISNNQYGICRVRKNSNGELLSESFARVSAMAVDPIEKKPLYHFYPGSKILSFGTVGCNFKCPYCQNWHISQNTDIPVEILEPAQAIDLALNKDIHFIAYTYSEPVVWYEWVLATAQLAQKKNIKNVMVTNGSINPEPLEQLYPFIDAMNIDVKAFNNKFYQKLCKAELAPVKRTVEYLSGKIHLELTMLIIPGYNDDLEEIKQFCDWVYHLDPDIPVHFSRYYPQYKFDEPPTSIQTLERIYQTAKNRLHYVFIGNVHIPGTDNSYCPHCQNILIERQGYSVAIKGLKGDSCSQCNKKVSIKNN